MLEIHMSHRNVKLLPLYKLFVGLCPQSIKHIVCLSPTIIKQGGLHFQVHLNICKQSYLSKFKKATPCLSMMVANYSTSFFYFSWLFRNSYIVWLNLTILIKPNSYFWTGADFTCHCIGGSATKELNKHQLSNCNSRYHYGSNCIRKINLLVRDAYMFVTTECPLI